VGYAERIAHLVVDRQWVASNRYVRDLTCQEREQYRVEPLCDEGEMGVNRPGYLDLHEEAHMSEQRCCDFCGRSEIELTAQILDGSAVMELDEDGLWVCYDCRARLVLPPVCKEAAEPSEELCALVGKSAVVAPDGSVRLRSHG
jgi:hypothetical protein